MTEATEQQSPYRVVEHGGGFFVVEPNGRVDKEFDTREEADDWVEVIRAWDAAEARKKEVQFLISEGKL